MGTPAENGRAILARGWETSGLSQADCASKLGVSDRTLRDWRHRYLVPTSMPVAAARKVITDTIEKLHALLDAMPGEPACQAVDPTSECQPYPVPEPVVAALAAPGSTTTRPVKRSSFFDGFS